MHGKPESWGNSTAEDTRFIFDEAFALNHAAVYRAAYAIVCDGGLAEDITQEVFLRLFRVYEQDSDLAPKGELLRPWLLRVTINCARNTIRGRSRASVRDEAFTLSSLQRQAPATPDLEHEKKIEIKEARQALSRVREPMRSCLLLKYQGFSYREIAEILSLNEANVGSLVARGRKEFMGIYGKAGLNEIAI